MKLLGNTTSELHVREGGNPWSHSETTTTTVLAWRKGAKDENSPHHAMADRLIASHDTPLYQQWGREA
jgi:hypothetical protein